jgi:hypothetical protein
VWKTWAVWQYSTGAAGSVKGISTTIDLDYFNGTAEQFKKYGKPMQTYAEPMQLSTPAPVVQQNIPATPVSDIIEQTTQPISQPDGTITTPDPITITIDNNTMQKLKRFIIKIIAFWQKTNDKLR